MKTYRKSELLFEAKKILQKNINIHSSGICSILTNMRYETKFKYEYPKLYELKIWISELLQSHSYYDEWLYFNTANSKFKQLTKREAEHYRSYYDHAIAHKGRLQWLDWMIEIHKEAEDIADGLVPKTRHIKIEGSHAILEMAKRYKVKK